MRQWKRCPGCGYIKCGACSQCFPAQAEWELQKEIAEAVAAEEDRARQDAGMIYCHDHGRHDGCIRIRTVAEIRAELRSEGRPVPARRMSWQQAVSELRRRYVSP